MKFRHARHTNHLEPIIEFYTHVIGLSVLGSFENHDGYDGVFIGIPDENWHLEFTVSWEQPLHRPDEDDLLIFYPKTQKEYDTIAAKMREMNIKRSEPKNPYWRRNGMTILDPDGFGVIIVKP